MPAGATAIPLTFYPSGFRLVASNIKLDGQDVRLALDTGAPHSLILSATPRPDEIPIETADGNGNPVTLYMSTISIALGDGPPRTVPVVRADKFPDLQTEATALGFTGLLGLSALGHNRLVISKTSLALVP